MTSKGYGYTGNGGRLPKASFEVEAPAMPPGLIKFAAMVRSLSAQTRVPVLNIIERARMEGVLECDDEQALSIVDLAEKLKPDAVG